MFNLFFNLNSQMVKFLLERPIAVTMTFVAFLVIGMVTSFQLPISLLPDTDIPKISVHINKENLSARELENTITNPLRRYLLQTAHLEDIRSSTYNEYAVIELDFEFGSDIDLAFIEANEKIDLALQHLPRDLQRPRVIKASATEIPAFYLNLTIDRELTSNRSALEVSQNFIELSNFAHQVIRKRIEQVPEVALVDMSGMVFPEILLIPDWEKLNALNISLEDLEAAIQQNNINLGNLTITDGQYQYNVRFSSSIRTIRDLEEIYLKVDSRIFQLKQLVDVTEQPQQQQGMVISEDKQAITMAVIKRSDARMNQLKNALTGLLENLKADYPHINFKVTRDQTKLLEYSISNLKQGLLWSSILAFLVMFFFLKDIRSPILIGITIPTTLVISLMLFYLFGISINIISLSGLILGVGMMVDNSIIVIDNISQHLDMGKKLSAACIYGVNEIFRPLLSSVLTTCAVFVPLIFLSGITGALFYDQAVAVAIGLFSSLIISVTLLPVYFHLFYKRKTPIKINTLLNKIKGFRYTRVYERGFIKVMRHQKATWMLVIVLLLATGLLFTQLSVNRLPQYDKNEALIKINWNESINLAENQKRLRDFLAKVKPHVLEYTALIGRQDFIFNQHEGTTLAEANLYINTRSPKDIEKVGDMLKEFLNEGYPLTMAQVMDGENIFEVVFNDQQAPLEARLRAIDNYGSNYIGQLENLLRSLKKGTAGKLLKEPEWQELLVLEVDYERLLLYDVSIEHLYSSLESAFNENTVLLITDNQYFVPVVIGSEEKSFDALMAQLSIENSNHEAIPVRNLVKQHTAKSLKSIAAGQEGAYFPIPFNIQNDQIDDIMSSVKEIVRANGLFEVSFSGSYFKTQALMKEMMIILAISLLLLYFILAAQFESLSLPFIVLLEVPIDLFGAFLFLWIFGDSINIMSMIGIIVMSGIIINDSILKIDTINQLRKDGAPLIRALHVAGLRRLKPILMTSITTILALIPFLLSSGMGADLQKPLALTIIAGMLIGTLVSIFIIPLLYYYLEKGKAVKQ
jgi:multidrug efflux pump subunit AcrB